MALAIMTSRVSITDPVAYWFLAARVTQSIIHLTSTSPTAVKVRFSAFAVQTAIGAYWAAALLVS